jgi:hypothetical protein
VALQVQQRFQAVQASLQLGADQLALGGRIDGARLHLLGHGHQTGWSAVAEPGGALRIVDALPGSVLQAGQRLQASSGAGCPA